MTLSELERAEKRMQQQWYDLVMAEQQGSSLEILERMYDSYILLVEEYNRCSDEYLRESQVKTSPAPKRRTITQPIASRRNEEHIKLAS